MATTVRNLDVLEAFEMALKIAGEYSIRGTVQSGTKIADFVLRKFDFANTAQMEISKIIPIEASFEISHFKPNSIFNDTVGFNTVQHYNADVVLMSGENALSYYLKSNATSGTFTVEEEISEDTWDELDSITFTGTGDFVAYKGHITASDTDNTIRIVLKGSYPYQVTDYTMYSVTYQNDSAVPEYAKFVTYALPIDLIEISDVTVDDVPTNDYKVDETNIYIDRDEEGLYKFKYHKIPAVIDDDSGDDYEFEIRKEAQDLIPFYMAALMIAEDKPDIANVAFQEYEKKLNLLNNKKPKKKQRQVRNTLWGGTVNDKG